MLNEPIGLWCAPVVLHTSLSHPGSDRPCSRHLIEVIPARPAVRDDAATTLDILVRITPPLPEIHVLRPPINLGIVLDRSGSMSEGRKMEHAREATVFAIRQLLPTDRVSITVFDDQVETIAPMPR